MDAESISFASGTQNLLVRGNEANRSNSAAKLQNINPITETAYLTSSTQLIECYVMCDDLGQ